MIGSAKSTKSAVSAPQMRQIKKKRLDATRNASLRSPFSSSSVKTGTKAPWSAESANRARTRFGTWKAIVKADITPVTPKYLAATTSRAKPSTRESPVANEKKAVLRARRRACPERSGEPSAAREESVATRYTGPPPRRMTRRGGGAYMANIHSQEKRIHRAERERLENRSRTSQVKTWFRRLESASAEGDSAKVDEEYRSLISRIDKAVKAGALHRNNGARKKSRASRIRSQSS